MSPFASRRSLPTLVTCLLLPAFAIASPLAASRFHPEGLSRRSDSAKIRCGNAPRVIAGFPVKTADIVVPSVDDGPPMATPDPSGYFPYLWCGAGTSTYVFIDPLGSYGYNKGTNAPIFSTGLSGAYNATQNEMRSSVAQGQRLPDGDGSIDGPHETSLTWPVLIGDVAGTSGVQWVQVFAQDASRQKLTWGIYGAALLIMMDFVTRFPLYADASYFRIGDGTWGTVGNGYVGIGLQYNGTTNCYLKGNPALNTGVICQMPSDYPDN